jgi:UPF0755 protein
MFDTSPKIIWKALPKPLHIIVYIVLALLLVAISGRIILRKQRIQTAETQTIYLRTGSTYQILLDSLDAHGCLHSKAIFNKLASLRGLPDHVRPGCYKLENGMGIVRVIQKFYTGNQDPVRITINKHRSLKSLTEYLDKRLELDGDSLLDMLNDSTVLKKYNQTPESILGMFIQNTYEVYWTVTATELLERMQKESNHFWNNMRQGQCDDVDLTENEVITLASIVEEETNEDDEKPMIASVYLNRLHKGMPLQADPTVRFALGDFSVKRIGGSMLSIKSPYNTYRQPGLPPGPICIPSIASIDAVLSGVKSDYLYFCAKEDFSGHHNFAATLTEHKQNAQRFHKALNHRNIK